MDSLVGLDIFSSFLCVLRQFSMTKASYYYAEVWLSCSDKRDTLLFVRTYMYYCASETPIRSDIKFGNYGDSYLVSREAFFLASFCKLHYSPPPRVRERDEHNHQNSVGIKEKDQEEKKGLHSRYAVV